MRPKPDRRSGVLTVEGEVNSDQVTALMGQALKAMKQGKALKTKLEKAPDADNAVVQVSKALESLSTLYDRLSTCQAQLAVCGHGP